MPRAGKGRAPRLVQLLDLFDYLFRKYLVGVVFTDALPGNFALFVDQEHRGRSEPVAEQVEHPVGLWYRGVEGGKQDREFEPVPCCHGKGTVQVVGADGEDLNACRVELRLGSLQLPELPFAERSPVSPVEDNQHRLFTPVLRECVLRPLDGRQREIGCQHRDRTRGIHENR